MERWYLDVLRKYTVFDGRARRKEFWLFSLANAAVAFSIFMSAQGLGRWAIRLVDLYQLAVLLPALAVGARRLHDTGKSGWWLLLSPIPLVNFVVLLFLVEEGDPRSNRYGPSPKGIVAQVGQSVDA